MSNDPLSPIAPARVRVLVLPAGRIKKQRFVTFLDRLHQHDSVRLGDISPDGRSSKTIFSPLAFPNGSLLYNFSTSMAPPSHTQLAPFDLFREPMMVLGIADALGYESSPKDELQEVADKLAEQFPKILVSQLLVMDCTAEQQESWSLDSAICVPPSHATKTTTMNTIMCDISAKLLSEMGTYATAVQALPSVQSPGAAARLSDSRPHLDRSLSLASRPESPADPSAVLAPSDTHPSRGPPTNFDEMGAHTRSDSGKMANRDRMSVQAFGSTSAQEKAKNKGKARVGIVVGNLYMLAGRWNDAWRELVENTNKARTATDYLWYAKGLESIVVCMLLLIWSGFDFPIPAICNSGPDRSSSLISSAITRDGVPPIGQQEPAAAKQAASRASRLLPDLVPMIISIYERTNTLAGEPMSPVAYSETVLRMSKLLAFLQNAVNAGFSGGISKHAIADMALRAYPPPSAGVPLADTIAIQSGIVSILSMLGLERKKAVIVKEMITLLVPALVQARKVGAAEMGIHPAASLSAAFGPGIPSAATNDEQVGLGNLLRDLHATYGARDRNHLDLTKGASDAGQENAVDVLINATIALTTQSAGTKSFGSINLKIDILRACIDFCEALPDLPGVVHFSALLLRVVGPQGTMTAHEQNRRVTLVTEEQLRLISNMSRTINAANKIGLPDVRALYWDDFLVRDVQWIDDTNNEKLRERHKSDLLFDSGNKPGKSPFLYNPFVKETHKTEDKIVVVGEPAELVITLQNPYGFEVRIDRLSLVTDGPAIEVDEHPITLGPARLQDVVVTARAKDEGQIKILGCSVHVYGCKDQVFPIYQSPWKPDFPSKVKELGLSARDPASATRARSSKGRSSNPVLPQPTTVSAMAIQAQPHVVLDKLNLSESALMKATFEITVLGKPGLAAAKVMFDYAHLGKPFAEVEGRAFTRQVAVPIDITVNASIQLHRIDFSNFPADYAWTNRGLQEQGQRPKTPRSPSHPVEKGSDRFRTLLDRVGLESSNEEHCLLLLDLRNSWPNPLTVSVQVRSSSADESWNRAYTVHEVVHPGHIARLVLLLPRLHIANPYAPIPILSRQNQRQFVVSADGPVSADLERATREQFWFREEVLKYLRGTWEEKGSDRCGNIDLRGLRMSPKMIDTIRLQDIDISMTIVPTESEEVQQTGRSKFVVTAESLLTLQTTIHNRSNGTIQALLRLQPTLADQSNSETSLDISRRLLISGTLQQCTPVLSPNSSVTLELGICPLISGEFDISALVEEVTLPTFEVKEIGEVETEDFEAGKEGLARKERRVWRGEEGCRIVVV
ncbi:unnamed protein product [Aureobasidium pullulans]|nr:unnamed protein product [Aureobasidium pullulans]